MNQACQRAVTAQLHSLPQLDLGASRGEFLAYFDNGWALTEMLFSALKNEAAYIVRPYHKLRHPMIFYYAHPAVLYVNKLRLAGLVDGPVDEAYELLFETGVDEMRWDQLHEKDDVWPTVEQVREYREKVYAMVKDIILTSPLLADGHPSITQDSPLWALVMGFEHERIHLETSSVLMRELPPEYVQTPENWPQSIRLHSGTPKVPLSGKDYQPHVMHGVAAQSVEIGKPRDYPSFGWDNEYGHESRHVDAFRAGDTLISNGEFYEFVTGGGYHDAELWSHEGWQWRSFRNTKWPTFWIQDGPAGLHHYKLRTCFEVLDMQWDWPVCVNYYEAKAYAAWKTRRDNVQIPYRLLTEAEHHALRADGEVAKVNSGLISGSESPVRALPANKAGFFDVFGNVWQWLEDHFHPLSGGKVHPLYTDFSDPCYDGEHQMIMGGSFASTGDEAGPWARFHFRPHFFQHAGFRLAQSVEGAISGNPKLLKRRDTSVYDTESMLNTYMLMHWGKRDEIYDSSIFGKGAIPDIVELPLAVAKLAAAHAQGRGRALDIGCAVGRASFEMAREFTETIGIDWSQSFVDAACALQQRGELGYWRKDQGAQGTYLTAKVDSAIDRSRVSFQQGDACNLPEALGQFDAVVLANLLCRLRDPKQCLQRLQGKDALVKRGGVVVMTTPLSWLEEYTPRENWLEGPEAIQKVLTEFTLVGQCELPFMIREHRRKFEYIVTQATVWKRK
ncbi:MAG TPA: 5-histidylcysteine sulfoxide synthase [Rickettsiales bacterium]|nr:5-histidylcysteine sulfoxide synthase [Rickettsiales bacterium]